MAEVKRRNKETGTETHNYWLNFQAAGLDSGPYGFNTTYRTKCKLINKICCSPKMRPQHPPEQLSRFSEIRSLLLIFKPLINEAHASAVAQLDKHRITRWVVGRLWTTLIEAPNYGPDYGKRIGIGMFLNMYAFIDSLNDICTTYFAIISVLTIRSIITIYTENHCTMTKSGKPILSGKPIYLRLV